MIGKQRTQQMNKTALGKWLEFDKHRALGIERDKKERMKKNKNMRYQLQEKMIWEKI